jgi:hypothetical protein
MEVFTIDGPDSCWGDCGGSAVPVFRTIPKCFKGSLYWHIDKEYLGSPPPGAGFLRFNLEDETFSFISHLVLPSKEGRLDFVELAGELCLTQYLTT